MTDLVSVNVTMEHDRDFVTVRLQSTEELDKAWTKRYASPLKAALEGERLAIAEVFDELDSVPTMASRLNIAVFARWARQGRVSLRRIHRYGFQAIAF